MSEIAALGPNDLQALRLATQVLRHKAALAGRQPVERYWADLGRAVDFEMARRGIGFVVGRPPSVALDRPADEEDRRVLADDLGLLAENGQLPAAVRDVCTTLRRRVTD